MMLHYFTTVIHLFQLHFHKDSLASLQQEVPSRMLPRELGGDAGPMKDLIGKYFRPSLRRLWTEP